MATADNQITANTILSDAFSQKKVLKPVPKVDIIDLEELKSYQLRKRTEYESCLKRNRLDMGQWMRYALWEVDQHDFQRARSVFERALLVDSSFVPLWIRYITSELKNKYVNHARNLLERAVSTLPRVDKLWYQYLFLEESLENWDVVRALYNKWISLEPATGAWDSYIEFEIRRENFSAVRDIFARYVLVYPQLPIWMKWIGFEKVYGDIASVRQIYSLAVDTIVRYEQAMDENGISKLLVSFANWEATQQEYERCISIFTLALEKWPNSQFLKDAKVQHEKKFGDSHSIQTSVTLKRKSRYKQLLLENSRDYRTWWTYLDLIESYFPEELIPEFERAVSVASQPLQKEVMDVEWRSYIFLWLRYLSYVELNLNDTSLCRSLYRRVINDVIPHDKFTSNKLWLMNSEFEIRQENISAARKILGRAIGTCPNPELFQKYIQLELNLKEFDRVRKLHEKFIEYDPISMENWLNYAKLEQELGDEQRMRSIYTMALNKDVVPLPLQDQVKIIEEFLSSETEFENYNNARQLYRQYLELGRYTPSIWISFAMYQSSTPTDKQLSQILSESADREDDEEAVEFESNEENFDEARKIYEEALVYFKEKGESESRYRIMTAFVTFEKRFGNEETQKALEKRIPIPIKKKIIENNIEREIIEYSFPEDQLPNIVPDDHKESVEDHQEKPNVSKFLALAKKWKETQG
ncbi:Clf1p KNAG_0G02360 [Huiozyma naganishii CBS 8797]|uniref:Pre-mRNA-splicing factor CLF1 n=1 Tax=Huiozyma naganishii (strain ATCC MYA-139 / BCRC 22969 / CBS 8797 / KCTC 17520 / NBRC 10181 / NCYC 3082 / Yp74L-3) TaxID=1071383 RepID=J7S816_HUIN7|nr:hypothetical protein KNAG_0G02360 [Kazachstania naganishii CBS 8797]CCK71294.1 hypothetical protein KNAG_0G02360 [Kazachstania naganishii CBS 8797]